MLLRCRYLWASSVASTEHRAGGPMSGISMKASKAFASRWALCVTVMEQRKKHLKFEASESDFSKNLAEVTAKRVTK